MSVLIIIVTMLVNLTGGILMAHEHGEGEYLSSKETVDMLYNHVRNDNLDSAVAYLKGLGEDEVIVQTWMNVQCDINNIKHDPRASARIGQAGVQYCLEKDYKLPAAVMLHNITAFFMPNWDEDVDSEAVPIILDAARQQVPLRREIPQPGPLMWALWDLGMAELVAGNTAEAIKAFEEGEKIGNEQDDKDGAAWCRLFIGKAKIKYLPDLKSEGEKDMKDAASIILEFGQDWEKESIPGILKAAGLE